MTMAGLHSTGVLHLIAINVATGEIVHDHGCFMDEAAVRYFVDNKYANVGPHHTIGPCCANPNHLGWILEPADPNSQYGTFLVRAVAIELYTLKEKLH